MLRSALVLSADLLVRRFCDGPGALPSRGLRSFFGDQIEGLVDETLLDAVRFPILGFKRKRPFFGF
jgi:hypothetical protein